MINERKLAFWRLAAITVLTTVIMLEWISIWWNTLNNWVVFTYFIGTSILLVLLRRRWFLYKRGYIPSQFH